MNIKQRLIRRTRRAMRFSLSVGLCCAAIILGACTGATTGQSDGVSSSVLSRHSASSSALSTSSMSSSQSSSNAINSSSASLPSRLVMAINAGGETVMASNGIEYTADDLFNGGDVVASNTAVKNTSIPKIHKSARVGASFNYSIPLEEGNYDVVWRFNETRSENIGDNQFNVFAEGYRLETGMDLVFVRGQHTAYALQTSNIRVTDGFLDLLFDNTVKGIPQRAGEATISAIEIWRSQPRTKIVRPVERGVFFEREGLVVAEAENYKKQSPGSINTYTQDWILFNAKQAPSVTPDQDLPREGASGNAYLEALPDIKVDHGTVDVAVGLTEKGGGATVLEYEVNFTQAGKYRFWARMFFNETESNSLHLGFNNVWPATGSRIEICDRRPIVGKTCDASKPERCLFCNDPTFESCTYLQQGAEREDDWNWESRRRYPHKGCYAEESKVAFIEIPNPGVHTIKISMREDGAELDKWILTNDFSYRPYNAGPPQTIKLESD